MLPRVEAIGEQLAEMGPGSSPWEAYCGERRSLNSNSNSNNWNSCSYAHDKLRSDCALCMVWLWSEVVCMGGRVDCLGVFRRQKTVSCLQTHPSHGTQQRGMPLLSGWLVWGGRRTSSCKDLPWDGYGSKCGWGRGPRFDGCTPPQNTTWCLVLETSSISRQTKPVFMVCLPRSELSFRRSRGQGQTTGGGKATPVLFQPGW